MAQLPQAFTLKALLENPDLLNPPKPNEGSDHLGKKALGLGGIQTHSAAIIPSLWDKTFSLDDEELDLGLVNFDDLMKTDDDLGLGGMVGDPGQAGRGLLQADPDLASLLTAASPVHAPEPMVTCIAPQSPPDSPVKVDVNINFALPSADVAISTIPGEATYDPRKRTFTEDELRPQPLIKKSKKQYVPEDAKDERYWKRRLTNNVAAKRSRDAKRIKMNQIALRTAFLEQENGKLKEELGKSLSENKALKRRIESLVHGGSG